MTDERNAAQKELRAAILELEDLRRRLLELAKRLAPAEEAGPREEDEERSPDQPAKLGAVVQCVIVDRLEPAIRDLAGAVAAIGDEEDDEEKSSS